MTQRLSCPQCGGREVEQARYAIFNGTSSARLGAPCQCRTSGTSCAAPARRSAFPANVNHTTGLAVICLLMLTAIGLLF